MKQTPEVPTETKEKLLAYLREGNEFAHPGEGDAIDMIFAKLSKDPSRKILDVGCGLGGTANFIHQAGFGHVTGIDRAEGVIDSAKKTYPDCTFVCCDVIDVDLVFTVEKFDVICMISSFFYFPDQQAVLKKLKALAKEHTKLLIFDYTNTCTDPTKKVRLSGDSDESVFNAIKPAVIKQFLSDSGWNMGEFEILSAEFETWYQQLVDKITSNKADIIAKFSEDAYTWAENIYGGLLRSIKAGDIGGCLLSASPSPKLANAYRGNNMLAGGESNPSANKSDDNIEFKPTT